MSTKNAEPGFDCPMIYWIENGNDFFARWRSEAGVLPPKRVQVVNDTLTADAAYRLGCEGTALLWRGDFQNARQLLQANFVERLREFLNAHPTVTPGRLEMEVLETSALEDLTLVARIIEDCRSLGVRFALDDFGTGYSSLTYLKRLSVAQLKIDQSFVRDMLDDRDDLAIVQGVVGLSKAFNRKVIAEGVETVAHGRKLLAMGCVLGQGYGIARPMPAQQVPGWLDQWRAQQPWVPQEDVGLPA